MTGNAFRILVDHHNNHIFGRSTVARFDILVLPSPDFKPLEDLKPQPKRAMMDLGGKFSALNSYDKSTWFAPRLDSKRAIWTAKDMNMGPQHW
jgi:hypothetical protein